jgi:hypothetical protein
MLLSKYKIDNFNILSIMSGVYIYTYKQHVHVYIVGKYTIYLYEL